MASEMSMSISAGTGAARWFLVLGGVNALIAVILGAHGAHGLQEIADSVQIASYRTAVSYQLTQGLGLVLIGLAIQLWPGVRAFPRAGGLLLAGIVLFCGGIYLKVMAGLELLGPLIPVGGFAFMLGWLVFVVGAARMR